MTGGRDVNVGQACSTFTRSDIEGRHRASSWGADLRPGSPPGSAGSVNVARLHAFQRADRDRRWRGLASSPKDPPALPTALTGSGPA